MNCRGRPFVYGDMIATNIVRAFPFRPSFLRSFQRTTRTNRVWGARVHQFRHAPCLVCRNGRRRGDRGCHSIPREHIPFMVLPVLVDVVRARRDAPQELRHNKQMAVWSSQTRGGGSDYKFRNAGLRGSGPSLGSPARDCFVRYTKHEQDRDSIFPFSTEQTTSDSCPYENGRYLGRRRLLSACETRHCLKRHVKNR